MNYTGFVISAAVIGLILLWQARQKNRFIKSNRDTANKFFSDLRITSNEPSFTFEGATADIVSEEETVDQSGGALLAYQLKRIARNSAGEYFYFSYRSDSKPYVKHLAHGTANALLGSKDIQI